MTKNNAWTKPSNFSYSGNCTTTRFRLPQDTPNSPRSESVVVALPQRRESLTTKKFGNDIFKLFPLLADDLPSRKILKGVVIAPLQNKTEIDPCEKDKESKSTPTLSDGSVAAGWPELRTYVSVVEAPQTRLAAAKRDFSPPAEMPIEEKMPLSKSVPRYVRNKSHRHPNINLTSSPMDALRWTFVAGRRQRRPLAASTEQLDKLSLQRDAGISSPKAHNSQASSSWQKKDTSPSKHGTRDTKTFVHSSADSYDSVHQLYERYDPQYKQRQAHAIQNAQKLAADTENAQTRQAPKSFQGNEEEPPLTFKLISRLSRSEVVPEIEPSEDSTSFASVANTRYLSTGSNSIVSKSVGEPSPNTTVSRPTSQVKAAGQSAQAGVAFIRALRSVYDTRAIDD